MLEKIDTARSQLEEFEKTKDVTNLENAIRAAEQIDISKLTEVQKEAQLRHRTVKLWLGILAAIDRSLDPKFDPNDLPEESITPPPSGAIEYPSAIDPSAIRDPVVRAQYEKALKENSQKAEHYRLQTKLRRLNPHATVDVDRFLTNYYTDSAADHADLESLLGELKLSSWRRQHLRSLVRKRAKN